MNIRSELEALRDKMVAAGDEAAAEHLGKSLEVLNDESYEEEESFKVRVSMELLANQICGFFVSHFDSSYSNCWVYSVDWKMPDEPDWSWCTEKERKSWEGVRKCYVAVMCGGYLEYTIHDDDGEPCGVVKVDKKALIRGLQVMATRYPRHLLDFINENDDAITSDILAQCCVFGRAKYG